MRRQHHTAQSVRLKGLFVVQSGLDSLFFWLEAKRIRLDSKRMVLDLKRFRPDSVHIRVSGKANPD